MSYLVNKCINGVTDKNNDENINTIFFKRSNSMKNLGL